MFWSGENMTLGQQAQKRVLEFAERKERYMGRWLQKLIECCEEAIMIASGLGETELTFYINDHAQKLDVLSVEWGSTKSTYEWTMNDRKKLTEQLIDYYGDENKFPYLVCRQRTSESVSFSWRF
jgi:hypothetical protein